MTYRNPYYDSQHLAVAASRFEEKTLHAKRYHAAILIQKIWRGYSCKQRYRRYRARAVGLLLLIDAATQMSAAATIQKQWRIYRARTQLAALRRRAAADPRRKPAPPLMSDDMRLFTACMYSWLLPVSPWESIIPVLSQLSNTAFVGDKVVAVCLASARRHFQLGIPGSVRLPPLPSGVASQGRRTPSAAASRRGGARAPSRSPSRPRTRAGVGAAARKGDPTRATTARGAPRGGARVKPSPAAGAAPARLPRAVPTGGRVRV